MDTPGKVKALKRAVRDATVVESVSAGVDIEVSTAAEVVVEGGQETRELLEEGDHDDDVEESNASLVVSMLTLVLSIPALIGA